MVARELKDAPTTALTFEAWVRSTDECNDGTLLSYSVDPEKCAALPRCRARTRCALTRERRYPGDDSTDNEFALFSTRELMARIAR